MNKKWGEEKEEESMAAVVVAVPLRQTTTVEFSLAKSKVQ